MSSEVGSFPNATPLTGDERILADQNGVTVNITPTQIEDFIAPLPGSGTVTSVGLIAPDWLVVSGTPIVSSGDINLSGASGLTTHQVLGTGTAGTLALETLTLEDLPLSQSVIGQLLYPQTATEAAAGVVPSNYAYAPLHPFRYGAAGDGVTDDTTAMTSWVAVINKSTQPVSQWPNSATFLCSPLPQITANNFTLYANGGTLLVKANSWTSETVHLSFSCSGLRVRDLIFNGNQAAFSAGAAGQGVVIECTDYRFSGCAFLNCAGGNAVAIYGTTGTWDNANFQSCRFESNAGLGLQIDIGSYISFTDCTISYNGYGFQNSWATNAFASFGLAIRFRSHHLSFKGCAALQNGRDGFNVNQGSYAIKFAECVAWMNDDGGFTIAADNTDTGNPGEGESPYDLEYIDCEAYNNYSSGIAAYNAVYDITIEGGRYYDNGRNLGVEAIATSYFNGIYIAAGSLGVNIHTKAYDDRQLCPITAVASSVLAATGWVAGTMANYPRVALYNASLAFEGYGTITAESAGSVTVETTANNGVTIADIAAGWFVSQRVQHNGVFVDNGSQGTVEVDGFGFLPGPFNYTGWKTISGGTANGLNVRVPSYTLDPNNELLENPTFDAGVSDWTFGQSGTGGAFNPYTTAGQYLRSAGGVEFVGGTGGGAADATLVTNAADAANNCWIEASVWCYAVNAGNAYLMLFWNGTSNYTQLFHPGGGWKQLIVSIFSPGYSGIDFRLGCAANVTCYFDSASCRVRTDPTDGRDYSYPMRNLPY